MESTAAGQSDSVASSPVSAALCALADSADLNNLWQQVAAANRELRFSAGLRRGWPQARAEAAVLSAVQVARAQGAIVPAMRLRHILADPETADTPSERVALAAWRMQAQLFDLMTDLNPGKMARPGAGLQGLSLRKKQLAPRVHYAQLISSFGRDWVAGFGDDGDDATLTPQVPGLGLPAAQAGLICQVCEADAPAWVRAAVAHADLACASANTGAGRAAAAALGKAVLITSGVDRTGVLLPSWLAALDPGGYSHALADYASGSARGVQSWLTWYLRALERAVVGGNRVARSVLAQSPWDGIS